MEFSVHMKLQIGSTGLLELLRLVLWFPSSDYVLLAGSKICKIDRDHQKNIKIVAVPILCNDYVQLNQAGMHVILEYT